jgi:imidazolonepropionase-like amidohydrolase
VSQILAFVATLPTAAATTTSFRYSDIWANSTLGPTKHGLEMENWVWMGLTPAQAIVAATRDSAAIGGFNTGMVAAGKSADFIVPDANPLDNIANTRRINKVYLRGLEVDRAAMRARWQAAWRTASAQ